MRNTLIHDAFIDFIDRQAKETDTEKKNEVERSHDKSRSSSLSQHS